jgi:hypothetical protein
MSLLDWTRGVIGMTEAPPGYEPRNSPVFNGESEVDRDQLLQLYYEFRRVNDALDQHALGTLWSADPRCVFFNSNGHTYYGLDDWAHIWDHYRPRLEVVEAGGSGTIRIIARGDMAVIIDDHSGHTRVRRWTAKAPSPKIVSDACSRVTLVCLREHGAWQVVHAHFSVTNHGRRPDQGGEG